MEGILLKFNKYKLFKDDIEIYYKGIENLEKKMKLSTSRCGEMKVSKKSKPKFSTVKILVQQTKIFVVQNFGRTEIRNFAPAWTKIFAVQNFGRTKIRNFAHV